MRKATSESCRISLSVSWLKTRASLIARKGLVERASSGRCDLRALEVLVRRAVVAVRQRRALARLALARGRPAARDAAVEGAGLDLALDERHRRRDALAHGPGDLRLAGDREIAADVLEERAVGLGEIERVLGEALHRLLAGLQHLPPVLDARIGGDIRVYQVLDRPVDGA